MEKLVNLEIEGVTLEPPKCLPWSVMLLIFTTDDRLYTHTYPISDVFIFIIQVSRWISMAIKSGTKSHTEL